MKLLFVIKYCLLVGITLYFGALLGFFSQSLWVVLLISSITILSLVSKSTSLEKTRPFSKLEKTLCFVLFAISLSHGVQVFVPETGFDAVWYHLPVAVGVLANNGLYYASEMYQSLNPPFSDLFFTMGYFVGGELGSKIIAYIFYVAFIGIYYSVCRAYVTNTKALALTVLVSVFQVVSWQAASFYIDVAKAFWELSLLWVLVIKEKKILKIKYYLLGLLLGASILTKEFSVLLVPLVLTLVWIESKSRKSFIDTLVFAAAMALPQYVVTYLHTGTLFFSTVLHVDKLQEIGGNASPFNFFVQRLRTLWQLPFAVVGARDYVFPPQGLLFIASLGRFLQQRLWDKSVTLLLLFSAYYYLLWWFVPPLSTRYALAGLATSLIFIVVVFEKWLIRYKKSAIACFFMIAVILFVPRLYVNARSLPFLVGIQSKKEYLDQFLDGNIDAVLTKWHSDTYLLK